MATRLQYTADQPMRFPRHDTKKIPLPRNVYNYTVEITQPRNMYFMHCRDTDWRERPKQRTARVVRMRLPGLGVMLRKQTVLNSARVSSMKSTLPTTGSACVGSTSTKECQSAHSRLSKGCTPQGQGRFSSHSKVSVCQRAADRRGWRTAAAKVRRSGMHAGGVVIAALGRRPGKDMRWQADSCCAYPDEASRSTGTYRLTSRSATATRHHESALVQRQSGSFVCASA